MNTITTTPAVKVSTDPVMSGDVFYGSFDTMVKGKKTSITVSNHLKDENGTYEFRVAAKCQAGFINITDINSSPIINSIIFKACIAYTITFIT